MHQPKITGFMYLKSEKVSNGEKLWVGEVLRQLSEEAQRMQVQVIDRT
jgi:hypothetical protein